MPTYDYVCGACGHVVEVIHGVHERGPTTCPNCHAHGIRKAIAAPTVLYKGSGWAKKDRGSNTMTKAAAKAGSGESGGASGSADSGSGRSSDGSTGSGPSSESGSADSGSGRSSDDPTRSGPSSESGSSSGSRSSSGAVTSRESSSASTAEGD